MPISHYDNLISVQILTKEVLHANKYGIKNNLNFSSKLLLELIFPTTNHINQIPYMTSQETNTLTRFCNFMNLTTVSKYISYIDLFI